MLALSPHPPLTWILVGSHSRGLVGRLMTSLGSLRLLTSKTSRDPVTMETRRHE